MPVAICNPLIGQARRKIRKHFLSSLMLLNLQMQARYRKAFSICPAIVAQAAPFTLHRTTRTVTLTPAGISFLEDAKNVVGRPDVASRKFPSIISQLALACSSANWLIFFSPMRKYFAASSMVRVHVRMHFSQMGISA